MKKIMNVMILMVSMIIFQCCSADDPITDSSNATWNSSSNNSSNSSSSGSSSSGVASSELVSLDIALDRTSAEPSTSTSEYFPEEEDNLDNNSFTTQVSIDLSAPVAKTENGVTITVNGGHITADHGSQKNICYVVTGSTDNGSLTILGEKKYEVQLNGVSITNPDSAALNLLSGKRAFVVVSGTNTLSDGTSSKNDHKGALYCKGKLLFNGTGTLDVYGNYNNAIHSADYIVLRKGINVYAKSVANHGIKANDGVIINGGIVNVEVSAAAAKGINSEQNITINGGRTTVIATGNGTYEDNEAKGAAAIKCDSTFTMNGGELYAKATGSGGKGVDADWEAYITGGQLYAVTTGGTYTYNRDDASPKGIKVGEKNVHGLLNISGGTVKVRCAGSEGIESKGTITISDGTVQVLSSDDAINAAGNFYLQGGNIVGVSTGNDGIDANGNMYIEGGNIVAFGAGGAEAGIDTSEQTKLYITGGSLFAIGGRIDASYATTNGSQAFIQTSGSTTANATVSVANGSTTMATFTLPPFNYNNGTIMVSAPGMQSGQSYTLTIGSSSQNLTATTTASNGMGGMGGGNMPGGRW